MLIDAHSGGQLKFFNTHAGLADQRNFKKFVAPLRRIEWVVYCKEPLAGPQQVLRYLSRYTHRIASSNRRLVAADGGGVSFRWKDYRIEGPGRWKTMTLTPHEFIRRFLVHVLPKGFHRIRHYGLLAAPTVLPTSRGPANCSPYRPHPDNRRRPKPQRPMKPTCCRGRARAAAAAWSSSRPSHAAASPSTGPNRHWEKPGSTPHEAVAADQWPSRHSLYLLVRRR